MPLSVDVLAMWNVHQGLSIEEVVIPVGDIKWEVVINEDAEGLTVPLAVGVALVSSVSVIYGWRRI